MNSCRKAGSTSIANPTHGATNASAVPPGQSPAELRLSEGSTTAPPKETGTQPSPAPLPAPLTFVTSVTTRALPPDPKPDYS
jgi:hypothetical protein